MERIVTLLPSATEIVCALGLESSLVGRSHECDYPASVTRLPVCTGPKLDPSAESAEIDRQVKSLVREGLSVYLVDAERLRALRPDVIVTQEQCEVCAVTPRDLAGVLESWLGQRPRILSLTPATLSDVLRDIERTAEALGVSCQGSRLVDALVDRITQVGEGSGNVARPRVACLEWLDPLMAAGNWIPELVSLAGGKPVLSVHGQHSPWLCADELRDADPDVIVSLPCGFDLERSRAETQRVLARPELSGLRAVRSGRVTVTDASQFFNRPGPRLVESLEILAEILHPDRFDFGHAGVGWARL
jgi:iron complex transport system substrate-binding protein